MASAKDSPRQKMIGMMYLVLTALLALNVSKDILDAFIVVNKGLETTNVNFTDRNEELYSLFNLAKSVDPVRVTPNWKMAQDVKKRSAELSEYISKLQTQLIAKTDGVAENIADTMQMANISSKDNYDTPTNILIGNSEDGSAGASRELKNKLNDFRSKLTDYILPADRKKVSVGINTDDPEHSEENENWELYNFYHRPLVASLTILSKLKNDVKNAEAITVDYLLKLVDQGSLKFDTVAAKVIPQSNYVLLGEEYKADLFIAAFNKTKNPEITVDGSQVKVERGLGKYSVNTSKEGIVDYSGTIKVTSPEGKEMMFPFKSEYIVARPALTVSADKMNVLYAGLENPISVSVPGVPTDRLSVSINNGTLIPTGKGTYNVKVMNGTKADVSVTALMENGERKNMGTMTFRVKSVPKPVAKLGNITDNGKMSKGEFDAQTTLQAYYDNFQFNATCKVTSYDMSYEANGVIATMTINNNLITQEQKNTFKKLRKNSKVYFENIKAVGPDGKTVPLSGLNIRVN